MPTYFVLQGFGFETVPSEGELAPAITAARKVGLSALELPCPAQSHLIGTSIDPGLLQGFACFWRLSQLELRDSGIDKQVWQHWASSRGKLVVPIKTAWESSLTRNESQPWQHVFLGAGKQETYLGSLETETLFELPFRILFSSPAQGESLWHEHLPRNMACAVTLGFDDLQLFSEPRVQPVRPYFENLTYVRLPLRLVDHNEASRTLRNFFATWRTYHRPGRSLTIIGYGTTTEGGVEGLRTCLEQWVALVRDTWK